MNNKKIIKNKKVIKNIKGGDGYSANPFQPIGGMMSYPRYSNNYRPVFLGELLDEPSKRIGYDTPHLRYRNDTPFVAGELLQNGGNNNSKCDCNKSKKEKNIFNLIKQNGGNPAITQVNAINEVSQLLAPLGAGALISTIMLVFLYHCTNKKPRKGVQLGGYTPDLESILAPLGKNNLLVLASLFLLHHFAIMNQKESKINKGSKISKLKKIQSGGEIIQSLLNSLLNPLGSNNSGNSSVIDVINDSFKNNKKKGKQNGGNKLSSYVKHLGNDSFLASSMFYLLEDIFSTKVKELNENDKSHKLKLKNKIIKKNNKLFYILSPISFNIFGSEDSVDKIFSTIKESKNKK
jgi:hypothetical protein